VIVDRSHLIAVPPLPEFFAPQYSFNVYNSNRLSFVTKQSEDHTTVPASTICVSPYIYRKNRVYLRKIKGTFSEFPCSLKSWPHGHGQTSIWPAFFDSDLTDVFLILMAASQKQVT